jgi:poly(ADP-ribose) glycohydrolase ARH3
MQKGGLKDKYVGAILGTAIGDALGCPMETMSAKDIAIKYPNFGYEDGRYISSLTRKAGSWSDDHQLSAATTKSIIKMGCIVPHDIAYEYTKISERRGWGRSTIEAVDRLIDGVPWFDASETVLGIGNGVSMRMASAGLVLASVAKKGDRNNVGNCLNSIVDIGKITHKEIGIKAGFLQSILISLAVRNVTNTDLILTTLSAYEDDWFGSSRLSDKLAELNEVKTIEAICKKSGVSSRAEESWPASAAVYLKVIDEKIHPIKALFDLIKQGGDTDSNSAQLATLLGARFGFSVFGKELITNLEDRDNIINLGKDLYSIISSPGPIEC